MQVAIGGRRRRKAIFDEINITPLTDIFLVMLIIMMVVAPELAHSRRDIVPPVITGGFGLNHANVTIEITRDGSYYVDGEPITADNLAVYLKGRSPSSKRSALVVQADRYTRNKYTLRAYAAAQEAGFSEITIAGQALSSQRAQELERAGKPANAPAAP